LSERSELPALQDFNVKEVKMKLVFSLALIIVTMSASANDYPSEIEYLQKFDRRASPTRKYVAHVSSKEKKDISFIVNTLGMGSLIEIAKQRSAIKDAGKRVDRVHPLNFLGTIFSDEQMKASMHAMQNRLWVWSEFLSGVKESSEVEANRNNIKPEYIDDFAARLGISSASVYPSIANRQWEQLVNILIDIVPRNTETDRYDM